MIAAPLYSSMGLANPRIDLMGADVKMHGTVVSRPCNLALEGEQLVEVGSIHLNDLQRDTHGPYVPFNIELVDCKETVLNNARVTFSGVADSELTQSLALTGITGAALSLFDKEKNRLPLTVASPVIRLNAGSNSLPFFVYLEGQPSALAAGSITPGEYSVIANFIVSYD